MEGHIWRIIRRQARIWREVILPGTLIVVLVVLVRLLGGLQVQALMTFDAFSRQCPVKNLESAVVIVGINEADLKKFGGFPISDQNLAKALQILQSHHPSVIGLDIFRDLPVEPGHASFVQALQDIPNIVGIEVALNSEAALNISPPPALPPERVGFADVLVDLDGQFRRSIVASPTWQDQLKYSFALRLAQTYLAQQGIPFHHGDRVGDPMRFGTVELPRFNSDSGGYIGSDDNGYQLLLNFCGHQQLFRTLSLTSILEDKFDSNLIRDRVVIIGMTASSIKDTFLTSALQETLFSQISGTQTPLNQLIYGVEVHAHVTNQIIQAVLNQQPLTQTWQEVWEYVWIVGWGFLGIALGVMFQSPWKSLLSLAIASAILIAFSYGLLILGWWIPVVPATLGLCGAGLVTSFFDRDLRFELEQRRRTIERTYEAVHNGPLQHLAVILRSLGDQDPTSKQLRQHLQSLNEELRGLYECMRQETLTQGNKLYLRGHLALDMQAPIAELLDQVYDHTLDTQAPGFETLQTLVSPNFVILQARHFSIEQKRGLCLFLQEALCNVAKHAIGATRLDVVCKLEAGWYHLRVVDNAPNMDWSTQPTWEGQGTRQARSIAAELGGHFHRQHNNPQGTVCQLSFPVKLRKLPRIRGIFSSQRRTS